MKVLTAALLTSAVAATTAVKLSAPRPAPAPPALVAWLKPAPDAHGPMLEVIVRRNDTLDAIFRRLSLSVEDLARMRNLPGIRQSLDALHPGDVITLSHLDGELTSLTRRVTDTQTLKVARAPDGDFAVRYVANALEARVTPLAGEISSSLFRSVNDAGASDSVALALADVFRYDIDFAQELQPGDRYTVVFEKVYRDGTYLRDGEILAAEFVNNGRTYRAVRYAGDGRTEYYTPDGQNLRKAFLRAPLEFSRVSSGFGLRLHPILQHIRAHQGIDYAATAGTPVHAAGAGRIAFRGVQGGYGNVLVLAHPNGIETVYGHLSRFAPLAQPGRRVTQGELIGYVGMSGLATGPHLHYEYRVNGVQTNPARIRSEPAEPVSAALRQDFQQVAARMLTALERARATAH